MTSPEKKALINKKLTNGDKRSYNEIAADLELEIWRDKFAPKPTPRKKEAK